MAIKVTKRQMTKTEGEDENRDFILKNCFYALYNLFWAANCDVKCFMFVFMV